MSALPQVHVAGRRLHVPFSIGQGLDSAGTTFRFGLALEPDREYELQLGTPHGYGFRNVSDGVPLAPYRLRFRTRPTKAR